jgi:hypothetical protein
MIKKAEQSLIKTNPYLLDPKDRQKQFSTAVITSSKIEGVSLTAAQLKKPHKRSAKKK